MENQEIYKRLWASDDEFARSIADDETISPALRALALCIRRDYAGARALYSTYIGSVIKRADNAFLQELQLMFDYLDGKDVSLLKEKAESLVENVNWSVFPRIVLALFLERERKYHDAIRQYQEICSLTPSNIVAIAGLARSYILIGEYAKSHSILLQGKAATKKLKKTKQLYWELTLSIYGFAPGMRNGPRILIGLAFFLTAFFPPIVWIFPALLIGVCLILMLFFLKRDGLAYLIIRSLVMGSTCSWLLGYAVRNLVVFLESL